MSFGRLLINQVIEMVFGNKLRVYLKLSKTSIFTGSEYRPKRSNFIEIETENSKCNEKSCNIRLCCPPIDENGIVENRDFNCEDDNDSGGFLTRYFNGFDRNG